MSSVVRRGALVLALVAAAVGVASPAEADVPTGIDVSHNQGAAVWPGAPDFAIVAVNTGMPNTINSALVGQLQQAALLPGTTHPRAEVYVNTANPRKAQAAWWPSGDRTRRGAAVGANPYGHCRGTDSAACSYVYGTSIAADDLETMGVPAGVVSRWWLDVEDANSWAGTPIPGADARTRNRAVLEGMAARLQGADQKVGLYALAVHFSTLIGAVPADSGIAALPTWLAGAGDQEQAASFCSRAPLARGRIQLVQWAELTTSDRFDHDLACSTFSSVPRPTIRGTHRVGARLTAVPGTWRPAAHIAYSWTRDGVAVASGRTYMVRKADAGHLLRVAVTATASGVSRGERTSAALRATR